MRASTPIKSAKALCFANEAPEAARLERAKHLEAAKQIYGYAAHPVVQATSTAPFAIQGAPKFNLNGSAIPAREGTWQAVLNMNRIGANAGRERTVLHARSAARRLSGFVPAVFRWWFTAPGSSDKKKSAEDDRGSVLLRTEFARILTDAEVRALPYEGLTLTDEAFAAQRLQGFCGYWLRRVRSAPPAHAALSDLPIERIIRAAEASQPTTAAGGDNGDDMSKKDNGAAAAPPRLSQCSLDALIRDGRLFVADYVPRATGRRPTSAALQELGFNGLPTAYFFRAADDRLLPLAIQLEPPADTNEKKKGNNFVTPLDTPQRWTAAKLLANHFESVLHAGGLHLHGTKFFAAVVIATRRCFAPSHPVADLLEPFVFTAVAKTAFKTQFKDYMPGQAWKEALEPGLWGGSSNMPKGSEQEKQPQQTGWTYDHFDPEYLFGKAGNDTLDVSFRQPYAYRDGLLRLWPAFKTFFHDAIHALYPDSDAALSADAEMAAFLRELHQPDLANHVAIPPPRTRADVAELLARMCFFRGPWHGADATRSEWFKWYPAAPMKCQLTPAMILEGRDGDSAGLTWDQLLATLPAGDSAFVVEQRANLVAIDGMHTQRLLHIEPSTTDDSAAGAGFWPKRPEYQQGLPSHAAYRAFMRKLVAIDEELKRDAAPAVAAGRYVPHATWMPSNVFTSNWF